MEINELIARLTMLSDYQLELINQAVSGLLDIHDWEQVLARFLAEEL